MADKVQLIKEEIERRIKECSSKNDISEGALALDSLLDFIDSLPEESGCEIDFTTKSEVLVEEVDNFLKDPVFGKLINRNAGIALARHFAEWQKQQMMKDAVELTITNTSFIPLPKLDIKAGDKVKIIIVKEEQQ